MDLYKFFPYKHNSYGVFIYSTPDYTKGKYFIFKKGRIVAILFHLPGFKIYYIVKCGEGDVTISLPYVEKPVSLLLKSVKARKIRIISKILGKNELAKLPEDFYLKLNILQEARYFSTTDIINLKKEYFTS